MSSTENNLAHFAPTEREEKLLTAIENHKPKHEGLLARLEAQDKKLAQFYGFDEPHRIGFLQAMDIVKDWAKENYGL